MVAFALVGTAAVAQTAESVLKNNANLTPQFKKRWMNAIENQCAQVLIKLQNR